MGNGTSQRSIESLRDRFRVDLSVQVEPTRLVVETALTNGTAETVHVFNVLWDFAPSGAVVGPDSPAYVCIERGELRFARRTLPIPAGKMVYMALDAYATPLPPGGVLREKMTFDVPVQEYSCYFRRELDSPVEAVESSTARFEYGVAVGAVAGAFAPAAEGALQLINPTKIEGILIVKSNEVPCRTQVMRRRDAFERF